MGCQSVEMDVVRSPPPSGFRVLGYPRSPADQFVRSAAQVRSHPIKFGSGDWTCVVGEFENGGRMVTVAKWRDGAIAEEYIWM